MLLPSPDAVKVLESLEDKYYKQYGFVSGDLFKRTYKLIRYANQFVVVSVQKFKFGAPKSEKDTVKR